MIWLSTYIKIYNIYIYIYIFFNLQNLLLICDYYFSITVNKNSIHGDANMLSPGGVRLGTSALTSRSFKEQDFVKVAEYLHRAVQIALSVQVLQNLL